MNNLHDIKSDKAQYGTNEYGERYLYLHDYQLLFIEMDRFKDGEGRPLIRLVQGRMRSEFPLFDLLRLEQVDDLIQDNLP